MITTYVTVETPGRTPAQIAKGTHESLADLQLGFVDQITPVVKMISANRSDLVLAQVNIELVFEDKK